MLKKLSFLCLALVLLLTACGEKEQPQTGSMPTVLNPSEYILYQNIFYNQTGEEYVGKEQTKIGTFTTIQDSYNGVIRYYVWGYNDQTKCCDWQWEFVPQDAASLPAKGSLVEVTGTFAASEDALDGYWLENAAVTVKTPFTGAGCDYELTTMGDTLERVQVYNIRQFPEEYEGKTIRAYGRVASPTSIEDPYYDCSWTQEFTSTDTLPAIGTVVILSGTVRDGVIADCGITVTTEY